jgi:hypothetical protein
MILELFGFLCALCIGLIIIGIARPNDSALALIGFSLLFLLAVLIIIPKNLEYRTGANINTTITSTNGSVSAISQEITESYSNYDDGTTVLMGYFVAVASLIGFVGVLLAIPKTKWGEE